MWYVKKLSPCHFCLLPSSARDGFTYKQDHFPAASVHSAALSLNSWDLTLASAKMSLELGTRNATIQALFLAGI